MRLSPHFALSEFLFSQTATRLGIDMTPSEEIVANLRRLCVELLEPLRASLNELERDRTISIIVSSGYRPPELNAAIGGSATSAHMLGLAADIRATHVSIDELAEHVEKIRAGCPLDQGILEFRRWLHVGLAPEGQQPRRQLLTAERMSDGSTAYSLGFA